MSDDIVVKVNQGLLRGKKEVSESGQIYHSFKGIPYAKPPIGELRFKTPQPADPWKGIWDATKHRDNSLQHRNFLEEVPEHESEDCLYLNVYIPQDRKKSKNNLCTMKPVMVWIHGGAFLTGSGDYKQYGPDYLIKENVIVVTLNYRLGVFGFLRVNNSSAEIPGNAGMKDMVMALSWVKENINNFDGDSNNVTVFGQSAGAVAVHLLLLSPLTEDLFHQAIIISGAALAMWALVPLTEDPLKKIASKLHLEVDNELEIVQKLSDLPYQQILDAQLSLNIVIGEPAIFGPTVERCSKDSFLPADPVTIIRTGNFRKVPTMYGYTSREGIFFKKNGNSFLVKDIEEFVPFDLNLPKGSEESLEIAKQIKNFYYNENEPSIEYIDITYLLLTDTHFVDPIYQSIREHLRISSENIFLFRFSVDGRNNMMKKACDVTSPGAAHADTNWYQFTRGKRTPPLIPNSVEDLAVKRLAKLFTNFAHSGDPNCGEKTDLINVHWKPVEENKFHYLEIGENLTTGINPDWNRQLFWDNMRLKKPKYGNNDNESQNKTSRSS